MAVTPPSIVWEINLTTVGVALGWVASIGGGVLWLQRLGDKTGSAKTRADEAHDLVDALEKRMDERFTKQEERQSSLLTAVHNNCTETAASIRDSLRDYVPRKEFDEFNRRHAETMREIRQDQVEGRREVLDSIKHLDDRLLTFIRTGRE